MKTIRYSLSLLAGISLCGAHAAPLTSEETEVKKLAEIMYSYDPTTFEYGDFDLQLRPYTRKYPPTETAKYNPAERCKLLKTMFIEAMLPIPSNKKDVLFTGGMD